MAALGMTPDPSKGILQVQYKQNVVYSRIEVNGAIRNQFYLVLPL